MSTETREVTDRNEQRARQAEGGWTVTYGDLINEGDVLTFIASIPTASVPGWVSQQIAVQLQKFSQTLAEVSDDVVEQATTYLKNLLKGNHSGERDINGLGVKAGFVTYHRKSVTKLWGKVVATVPLPNNYQPYIGLRVIKPLPSKGHKERASPEAPAVLSFDSKSWYKIKNAAKPGMALDVVNDGNQQRDGKLQMTAEGNFSGQHWQLRPSKTSPGAYNLCTMWLGTNMVLDVYGDDKTRPHLATAGAYSGQQWRIESQGNGMWKLTNMYSGTLVLVADASGSELHLRDPQTSPVSQWILQLVRPITESGFGL
jgi:hypothetical protein